MPEEKPRATGQFPGAVFTVCSKRNFKVPSGLNRLTAQNGIEAHSMKTLLKLTLAATLACALPAWACTPEEATAKREQLAKEVAKLTEQNPKKAKEINDELQKMDLGTASADLPDKCQLIDQRLRELETADKKAES
jgi:alcohol dehydrogenase YqhD (iron-dependent ADH family)